MSEEHKVYVPIVGTHVQPAPTYMYIDLPPDTAIRRLRRWITRRFYRAGVEFNRKERFFRLWRLSVSWDWE